MIRQICSLGLKVWLLLAALVCTCQGASLKVNGLKCEYRNNPLGIDIAQPRLSWNLESRERGQRQTAYQVLVATTSEKLSQGQGDAWDSGKIESSQTVHVVYHGKPLPAGQRVYWKVRVWDKGGKESAYGPPAWWEMGLLAPADWRAAWITRQRPVPLTEAQRFEDDPAPLFRKEFALEKKIRRARVYVSGLGYYELRLNGRRVGDNVLDPGWTSVSKRVLYSTYDVTDELKQGPNALGLMLGNGWFNPLSLRFWKHINLREHLTIGEPRGILQLVIDFADGSSQTITTDQTWKVGSGPVLRNNLYLGEVYDARKERPGWDRAGFDDGSWERAILATEPLGQLRAQDAPPIRITRTLQPVKLSEPKPGVFIFDMGQNFAGWVRLRVKGAAGTRISLRYGELVYPDGTLNGMTAVCGQIKGGGPAYCYPGTGAPKTAWQMDEYTLKGEGQEIYTPRFTFHGFRYVEVKGYPGKPTLDTLEGLRLNSDVASAGSFACSNERFNRIQQMVLWTELSNLFSVESDCPHREKFGYGGDIVAASEMALFNFDMARFYAKSVDDLADAVRPNGGFTETAPFVGIASEGLGEKSGPIGWGTAQPLLQCQLYQYYGDRRILEEQYETTKRWLAFLQSKAIKGILDNGISDHESLVPKPRALTGTAFYYFNAKLFAQIARVLGKERGSRRSRGVGRADQDSVQPEIPATGHRAVRRGHASVPGLCALPGAGAATGKGARARGAGPGHCPDTHKGHLSTGIFGTKYMLNALSELGRADVAYEIVNQRDLSGLGAYAGEGRDHPLGTLGVQRQHLLA